MVDKSGYEISATIWGSLIDNLDCTIGSVIIIKSARISDFRGSKSLIIFYPCTICLFICKWLIIFIPSGKGLSTTNSTVLITNPSLPEATELSEWYYWLLIYWLANELIDYI